MKKQIQTLIGQAVDVLVSERTIPISRPDSIQVEYARDPAHGDFASNIAMVLARSTRCNPKELAGKIIARLPATDLLDKTEIAGPGFINFFLTAQACQAVVVDILNQAENYGSSTIGLHKKVLLEFVSANPTGPLHIGHGRGAAYGAAVANLLKKVGFNVSCEYYVNDAGRQVDILAVSIWLRYLQEIDRDIPFPDQGYQGDYITSIAADLLTANGRIFNGDKDELVRCFDERDPEIQIDKLVATCKRTLGKNYRVIFDTGLEVILDIIKNDLENFGVEFDNWFSEQSLVDDGTLNKSIQKLTDGGWTYEKDGAQWFRASRLGDEKDRVLVRENGQTTYFAADIAYHLAKAKRGYDKLIAIWGADHHGYIARVKAAMRALEISPDKLEILLVQFATLYRGGEKLPMSTRSGEFVTLNELQQEVGKDAARFFYILRKSEQHLDFDLELAKAESNDNPVYYIQYAHARICSVFRQMSEQSYAYKREIKLSELDVLTEPCEIALLRKLAKYGEVIESAACSYEPHQLAYYLRDLANDFHSYYNSRQFLVEQSVIRNARLALIDATRQVLNNGLSVIGVAAPEMM